MPTNSNQNHIPTDNQPENGNIMPRDTSQMSRPINPTLQEALTRSPQNTSSNTPQEASTLERRPVQQPGRRNEAVVRTFKDDIQHLVRNQKVSMTHIAAAESDRKSAAPRPREEVEPSKKPLIIGLVFLFLTIAAVFGLGFYYIQQLDATVSPTQQLDPAIIATEARQSVDITDRGARGTVEFLASARRTTFFSLGSVAELYLTRVIKTSETETAVIHVSAVDFLNLIEAHVPQNFKQSMEPKYILGIHTIDENAPFLVFRTNSYGHAFSGMLAWESDIEADLLPLFSPNADFIKPATAEGGNAFKDAVIDNLDVRVLYDSTGKIRIVYAFINRTSVVITTNVQTLSEIADRIRVN